MKKTILIILSIVAAFFLLVYLAFFRMSYLITDSAKDNDKIARDLNWTRIEGVAQNSRNSEEGLGVQYTEIQYLENSAGERRLAFQPLEHLIDNNTRIVNSANKPINFSDIKPGDKLWLEINKNWCFAETSDGKNNRCIVKVHYIEDRSL